MLRSKVWHMKRLRLSSEQTSALCVTGVLRCARCKVRCALCKVVYVEMCKVAERNRRYDPDVPGPGGCIS